MAGLDVMINVILGDANHVRGPIARISASLSTGIDRYDTCREPQEEDGGDEGSPGAVALRFSTVRQTRREYVVLPFSIFPTPPEARPSSHPRHG